MYDRLIPTRDLFLCQAIALLAFLAAQRLGYSSHNMLLGFVTLAAATAASALLGRRILDRSMGALNAYSVALGLGTLIFWLKWWVFS